MNLKHTARPDHHAYPLNVNGCSCHPWGQPGSALTLFPRGGSESQKKHKDIFGHSVSKPHPLETGRLQVPQVSLGWSEQSTLGWPGRDRACWASAWLVPCCPLGQDQRLLLSSTCAPFGPLLPSPSHALLCPSLSNPCTPCSGPRFLQTSPNPPAFLCRFPGGQSTREPKLLQGIEYRELVHIDGETESHTGVASRPRGLVMSGSYCHAWWGRGGKCERQRPLLCDLMQRP